MAEDKPDNVLVIRAIGGDGDSFTKLCGRYYASMVAIAHAILGDRHLAEDAAQQAFAKAAVNLPRLRKPAQFGSWLAAICRNAAKDLLWSGDRHPSAERLPEVGAELPNDDVGHAVREALRRLEPAAREVIYLRFYDGLSYEQIFAVLGMSEQAVNGRLRRAKRTLAEYLRREGLGNIRDGPECCFLNPLGNVEIRVSGPETHIVDQKNRLRKCHSGRTLFYSCRRCSFGVRSQCSELARAGQWALTAATTLWSGRLLRQITYARMSHLNTTLFTVARAMRRVLGWRTRSRHLTCGTTSRVICVFGYGRLDSSAMRRNMRTSLMWNAQLAPSRP